jgi:hypothetical protein
MTGMKEGAGEDPFAEDDAPAVTGGATETDPSDETDAQETADSGEASETDQPAQSANVQFRIPYKFRRDGVQDGRDRVPLFIHEETKRAERDALHALEDHFDDDVSLTDLREALVMVGLDHLDEVEGQLEEWGYGMTFEE